MHGIEVTGDYLKTDGGWGWPPTYDNLTKILGPALDFLAPLSWTTDRARFDIPRAWFDIDALRNVVPVDSPLKPVENLLLRTPGHRNLIPPGCLPIVADFISSDWSLLLGINDHDAYVRPSADATPVPTLDIGFGRMDIDPQMHAIIAGVDGGTWSIHARDVEIIDLIAEHLADIEDLKLTRLIDGVAVPSPQRDRPRRHGPR